MPSHRSRHIYQPWRYLQCHQVVNPRKPEKLRALVDCAAKHCERSLDCMIYQGSKATANVVGILPPVTKELIAISFNVEEMFTQVWVPGSDRKALQFLWRPKVDVNREACECQMTVHPFAARSSPLYANYVFCKADELLGPGYDQAVSEAIGTSFCVKGCLTSFAVDVQVITFARDISELPAQGASDLGIRPPIHQSYQRYL